MTVEMKKNYLPLFSFLIILAVWFFPVLIFYEDIKFDRLQFVNEWLKTIGSGLFLGFVFHYLLKFTDFKNKKIELINILKDLCVSIDKVIELIEGNDLRKKESILHQLNQIIISLEANSINMDYSDKEYLDAFAKNYPSKDNNLAIGIIKKYKLKILSKL